MFGKNDIVINKPFGTNDTIVKPVFGTQDEIVSNQPSALKTIGNVVTAPVKYPLKVIGWIGERASETIGGAIDPFVKEKAKLSSEVIESAMYAPSKPGYAIKNVTGAYKEYLSEFPSMFKESGKNVLGALHNYNMFAKKNPNAKTVYKVVSDTYWNGMLGRAPEGTAEKVVAGAAGLGAEVLIPFPSVGKFIKGAEKVTKLAGKKTGVSELIENLTLPKWGEVKYADRVAKTAARQKAEFLARSVAEHDLKDIALKLSERTGKVITPTAVQGRLVQITKGGITTGEELQTKANAIKERYYALAQVAKDPSIVGKPLFGDETFLSVLTKAEKSKKLNKIMDIKAEIKRLTDKVPYKDKLTRLTESLTPDINKQLSLQNKLMNIGMKAEDQAKNVQALTDEFIDAAIEVTTGSPLSKNVAKLLDFAPGDKRLTDLGNRILKMEKLERIARNKEANLILNTAAKIDPRVSKMTDRLVKDILTVADKIEDTKVLGKSGLQRYIANMKFRFPGKAKLIQKLTDQLEAERQALWVSETYGGGSYFPRMYATKELEKKPSIFNFFSKNRIKAPYAKQRDLFLQTHPEVRKEMKEITGKGLSYVVRKSMIQMGNDIETSKLFKQVYDNPQWSSRIELPGFKLVPDEKRFGILAGQFVHPKIYADINEMTKIPGNLTKMYDTYLSMYKSSKVAWSPSTWFHNIFGDSMNRDLGGVDHIKQIRMAAKASKEYKNKTEYAKIMSEHFGGNNYATNELEEGFKGLSKLSDDSPFVAGMKNAANLALKIARAPGKAYGKMEQMSKSILFLSKIEDGASVDDAIKYAQHWGIDYGDLSTFEKKYLRRAIPFYTFPRKALPLMYEGLKNNPLVMAKYSMAASAMQNYSLTKLNISDDDEKEIQKVMPEYMKNDSFILMPYRDKNGDLRFADLGPWMPWQVVGDIGDKGLLGILLGNPLLKAVYDTLPTINKNSFTSQPIWNESVDDAKTKFAKKLLYMFQAAAPVPGWAPGGTQYNKMYRAITGKQPSKSPFSVGKKELLPEAMMQTVGGLSTKAFDVEQETYYRQREKQDMLNELKSAINKAMSDFSNGQINEKDFEATRDKYLQRMTDLLEE